MNPFLYFVFFLVVVGPFILHVYIRKFSSSRLIYFYRPAIVTLCVFFTFLFFFLILHRLPFTPFFFCSVYLPFCALFPLIPRSFCKQRKGVVLVFAIIFNQTLLFKQLINSNDETLHDTPTHANNLQRVTDDICLFTTNVQFSSYTL